MVDIAPTGDGTPVSGGDFSGSSKAGAFDDSLVYIGDSWVSSQANNSVPNQIDAPSFIGYDFGEGNTATITSLNLWQHPSLNGNSLLASDSVAIEWSDDASSWTELEKFQPTTRDDFELVIGSPIAKRAWRLRALKNVAGGAGSVWAVRELDLHGTLSGAGGGGRGMGIGIGRRMRRRR